MQSQKDSRLSSKLTATELNAKIAGKEALRLIDVRSPLEFQSEHIAGAANIPLPALQSRIAELSDELPLVLICRSGKRAENASAILQARGFQAMVLEGGIVSWQASGLDLVEGRKCISLERQVQLVIGIGVLTGVLLSVFVNKWFLLLPAFFGAGLTFAGLSGSCGLAILLMKAPWNQLPDTVSSENRDAESSRDASQSQSSQSCCSRN